MIRHTLMIILWNISIYMIMLTISLVLQNGDLSLSNHSMQSKLIFQIKFQLKSNLFEFSVQFYYSNLAMNLACGTETTLMLNLFRAKLLIWRQKKKYIITSTIKIVQQYSSNSTTPGITWARISIKFLRLKVRKKNMTI